MTETRVLDSAGHHIGMVEDSVNGVYADAFGLNRTDDKFGFIDRFNGLDRVQRASEAVRGLVSAEETDIGYRRHMCGKECSDAGHHGLALTTTTPTEQHRHEKATTRFVRGSIAQYHVDVCVCGAERSVRYDLRPNTFPWHDTDEE